MRRPSAITLCIKHPCGVYGGHWVVCLDDKKVTGLGLSREGCTFLEMGGKLRGWYNDMLAVEAIF